MKLCTELVHRVEHVFIVSHPAQAVRPGPAFHSEAVVASLRVFDGLGNGPVTGPALNFTTQGKARVYGAVYSGTIGTQPFAGMLADVDVIAFTGSRQVGVQIHEQASRWRTSVC